MCEALDGHEDSVSIGGRPVTNFRFADDIVVNEKRKKKLASWWNNHHKVQNEDRSGKDKSDDKQSHGFQREIKITGQRLEEVKNFKYL